MKFLNKKIIFFPLFLITISLFAEDDFKLQFIKGDISAKTSAVKKSTGEDGVWLSEQAVRYVLDYKDFISTDRDTEGLVVAAILSTSPEYVSNLNDISKKQLIDNYKELFLIFNNSSTVQIALNSKISSLKKVIPYEDFTLILNDYLSKAKDSIKDLNVLKSTISALQEIGNSESFVILYDLYQDEKLSQLKNDILQTMSSLVDTSVDVILSSISNNNIEKSKNIFAILSSNKNISSKNSSIIAENILNKSILSAEASLDENTDVEIQMSALNILNENKWTRASSLATSFFELAKKEYSAKIMSEEQFVQVITSLFNIAPLSSTASLSKYLEEINNNTENKELTSEKITQAVINTLGNIGDKTAFDSLLAVTYLGYSDSTLSAAREALAKLKW